MFSLDSDLIGQGCGQPVVFLKVAQVIMMWYVIENTHSETMKVAEMRKVNEML